MGVKVLLQLCCLMLCTTMAMSSFALQLTSETSRETSTISKAIIDVINKSFLEDISIINIITVPNDESIRWVMGDITDEISSGASSEVIWRVGDIDNVHNVKGRRRYSVILISNYESFEKFERCLVIGTKLFQYQGYFLLVFVGDAENRYDDIVKIFRNMWRNSIPNVNVLVPVSDSELEMFTFFPYTALHCSNATPIMINKFKKFSFIRNESFYVDKIKNLYKCPLKVATFNVPPLMFAERNEKGEYEIDGIDGKLLKGKLRTIVSGSH